MIFQRVSIGDLHYIHTSGFVFHRPDQISRSAYTRFTPRDDLVEPDIARVPDKCGNHNLPGYNKQGDLTISFVKRHG